jgi:hypothetical protein
MQFFALTSKIQPTMVTRYQILSTACKTAPYGHRQVSARISGIDSRKTAPQAGIQLREDSVKMCYDFVKKKCQHCDNVTVAGWHFFHFDRCAVKVP